jgi:dCTP deaminase
MKKLIRSKKNMLSASKIEEEIKNGKILIEPFDIKRLNPNSYNVSLQPLLRVYSGCRDHGFVFDPNKENPTRDIIIPKEGFILQPNTLYLGATNEIIGSDFYVPNIDGRSSTGRGGLQIHLTAGFGDVGFKGTFTLEMIVTHPYLIRPNDIIAQVSFEELYGDIKYLYNGRYKNQYEPEASRGFKEKQDYYGDNK